MGQYAEKSTKHHHSAQLNTSLSTKVTRGGYLTHSQEWKRKRRKKVPSNFHSSFGSLKPRRWSNDLDLASFRLDATARSLFEHGQFFSPKFFAQEMMAWRSSDRSHAFEAGFKLDGRQNQIDGRLPYPWPSTYLDVAAVASGGGSRSWSHEAEVSTTSSGGVRAIDIPTSSWSGQSEVQPLDEFATVVQPSRPTGLQTIEEPQWVKTIPRTPTTPSSQTTPPCISIHAPGLKAPEVALFTWALPYLEDPWIDQDFQDWTKVPQTYSKTALVGTLLKSAPKEFVGVAQRRLSSSILQHLHRYVCQQAAGITGEPDYRSWLAVMRHYTRLNTAVGWLLAEAVFHMYRSSWTSEQLRVKPVFDLVWHLLATNPAFTRIREVLFPTTPHQPVVAAPDCLEFCIAYLQEFCERDHSAMRCLRETKRIIEVAARCGLPTAPHSMLPAVRRMVRTGDLARAHAFVDDLGQSLERADFQSLTAQFALLNAYTGHWSEVDGLLDYLHAGQWSRNSPMKASRFFQRILVEHIDENRATSTFEFAVNAIDRAGLIPTPAVSGTVICACIRDGRYDLVAEWLRATKERFPRSDMTFGSLQGGWMLADTLSHVRASCEEVARVCWLLARGSRKEPFSPNFRQFAMDLIQQDLVHRLAKLIPEVVAPSISIGDLSSMTLEDLLKSTYTLRAAPATNPARGTYVDDLKEDLATQTASIVRLAKLFRGDVETVFLNFADSQDNTLMDRRQARQRPLQRHRPLPDWPPATFAPGVRPKIHKMKAAVIQYYFDCSRRGLLNYHGLLSHFITFVGSKYPRDVLEIVEVLHGACTEGTPETRLIAAPFATPFYRKWLLLVSTDGDKKHAQCVLQAVIDGQDNIEWNYHFLVLCDLVAQLGDRSNDEIWYGKEFPNKPDNPEMASLFDKIHKIWHERKSDSTFKFLEWQDWEEQYAKLGSAA